MKKAFGMAFTPYMWRAKGARLFFGIRRFP